NPESSVTIKKNGLRADPNFRRHIVNFVLLQRKRSHRLPRLSRPDSPIRRPCQVRGGRSPFRGKVESQLARPPKTDEARRELTLAVNAQPKSPVTIFHHRLDVGVW